MAITAATIKGRLLIQLGDNPPVELGTIEIPIRLTLESTPSARPASERDLPRGSAPPFAAALLEENEP